jgi:hypothetical protein
MPRCWLDLGQQERGRWTLLAFCPEHKASYRSALRARRAGAPNFGGRSRRRSGDLALFRRALYQLSYPTADLTGFEPAASGLTGRRALQAAPQVLVTSVHRLAQRSPTARDSIDGANHRDHNRHQTSTGGTV